MKRLHYFSGLAIALFAGLHLLNHLVAIAGAESHLALMDMLRLGYRHRLGEPLLLAAVGIQVASGITLFFRTRKTAMSFWDQLQRWSGLYLALFLGVHLSAVLSGRFVLHLDTNFYFGVAGLNTFPFNLFFVPYYGLAILALFSHIAAIHHKKMTHSLLGLSPEGQAKGIVLTGMLVLIATFYGLTAHFHGVEIPAAYGVMVGK